MKFYDTSSLLELTAEKLGKRTFVLSSITLKELEEIKNSKTKSENIKIQAQFLTKWLMTYKEKYEVIIFKNKMLDEIETLDLPINNDTKILASAIFCDKFLYPDDLTFVTNDLSLYNMANLYFGSDSISSVQLAEDDYTGYKEIQLNDCDMADFYSGLNQNKYNNYFNLLTNEYLILKNSNNEVVDLFKWNGKELIYLKYNNFNSDYFGKIKPQDIYQKLAFDSLINNKITMLKGPAGSGKTYAALGFLISELEKHRIDKIIVFCNTVATKNSARLGFYPGTRDQKLIDSQIGNLLGSKLGSKIEVENLIAENKLILLPFSDIRGYDTTGMNAGIYISEAQNLDITLMKLALQRIGEDSICIIDGDCKTQVDDISFAGNNNGMKRASKVFRGSNLYGEITLKYIHRSKIAELAEKL